MALPLRPQSAPRCMACLRSYASGVFAEHTPRGLGAKEQIRGKKKMANNSATVSVRLLKNVRTFGQKGSIIPLPRGLMRNYWFPHGMAAYVTVPELKTIRLKNIPVERDYRYGVGELAIEGKDGAAEDDMMDPSRMSEAEITKASAFQKSANVTELSPQRSTELVEIFVRPRLDFYRQPIVEEKSEAEKPAPGPKKRTNYGTGAAADLMASRMRTREVEKPKKEDKAQAIYGSVSPLDVLTAVRAAMAVNDEAARVVLHEEDIRFVELSEAEGGEAGRVAKHVGDFPVEIKVKGDVLPVRRTVRIIPQEL